MNIKEKLIRLNWFLSEQVGINILKISKFPISITKYFFSYINFLVLIKKTKIKYIIKPCINDWYENAGDASSEYFLQDLYVARLIFKASPVKHVDIGSRIDGFVAHVASFREIEIFDIRSLDFNINNIIFKQADLMDSEVSESYTNYADSVSCLHAIEHFGLGRYGDKLNLNGIEMGITNISKILKKNGDFYLSTPIGIERIEFNANWVSNPYNIINIALNNNLLLDKFILIKQDGSVIEINLDLFNNKEIKFDYYSLGIFIFKKI
jgi:hypothetical protein